MNVNRAVDWPIDCAAAASDLKGVKILPALTTTDTDAIPAFIRALAGSDVREIALFPTALDRAGRAELYRDLEGIPGLRSPHVHLRTDCDREEISYLMDRFHAQVFNIHPQASRHPFGEVPSDLRARFFVENVEVAVGQEDLARAAGLCPDYSHLESARLRGDEAYVRTTERQLSSEQIGCCHVSAIRPGVANSWNGGADHHRMASVSDLDYMARYALCLPLRWVSLELENALDEQLEAVHHLGSLLGALLANQRS